MSTATLLATSGLTDEVTHEDVQVPTIDVPDSVIKDLSDVFRMLSDKSRLKIVLALLQEGKLHVTALKDLVNQTQPAVSHHLTLMRANRVVDYDRSGKHNYYYLASGYLAELLRRFFEAAGTSSLKLDGFSLNFSPEKAD
jgi:ArsR family transcriptional regulator